MKLRGRKLYNHGQNKSIFLLALPKIFCEDMNLTKDTLVDVEYQEGKIIITKTIEEN